MKTFAKQAAQIARASGSLVGLTLGSHHIGGRKPLVYADAKPRQPRPFHMESEQIVVKDGKEKIVSNETEDHSRTGVTHKLMVRHSPNKDIVFRSVEGVDGSVALIMDEIHAKSTAMPPAETRADRNFNARRPVDCVEGAEVVDGHEQLFGQDAVRVSIKQKGDLETRLLAWKLLEFNCLIAQDYAQVKGPDGEWHTTQGNRLTAFREAEPDPALFTSWRGYTEMKPGDMKAKWSQANGLTPESCPQCFQPDPSDKNYASWHREGQQR